MAFDLAAAKAIARRAIHDTLSLDADYHDRSLVAPVRLRVRYHTKQNLIGDLESEGYPMTIDGIDRVVFDIEELALKGVQIQRGATVTLTAGQYQGLKLVVETQDKSEGPIEEIWRVAKV